MVDALHEAEIEVSLDAVSPIPPRPAKTVPPTASEGSTIAPIIYCRPTIDTIKTRPTPSATPSVHVMMLTTVEPESV